MARDFTLLDSVIRRLTEEGTVPGCAVCIMQGDTPVYEGFSGMADLENGKPINAASMFRQASTTKLFTYAILGMLYEQGHFLFSDPVSDYLPEWKNTRKYIVTPSGRIDTAPLDHPLTIRNAVAMMCGLPYCMMPVPNAVNPTLAGMSREMEELLKNGTPTLQQEVRAMSNVPVMFEPGTHWLYGFGSEITGALVETLTDKPLREVFRDFIIDPMGLEHTDTYITDANRNDVVTNYGRKEKGVFLRDPESADAGNNPAVTPVGARPNLITSARDFAAFMQMLANGGTYKGRRYLGEGTVAMLHENQLGDVQLADFTNDYLAGYGYGLGFRTLMTQKYGHNGHLGCFGWTGGAGTWVEADPVDHFSVTYMHNMHPNDELYCHHRVRSAAYACMLTR